MAKSVADLTVADVMRRSVLALGLDTSLAIAAHLFSEQHISGAPVIDEAGTPVGVLSLYDLVSREETPRAAGKPFYYVVVQGEKELIGTLSHNPRSLDGTVSERMTAFVLSVSPSATLLQAMRLMLADEVHRLLVIDRGRLVG